MSRFIAILRKLLFPISILYGIVVYVRNKCYDRGLFSSKSFEIPIICVGNITVGGTGKTPHTEYLIRQFQKQHKIAVLSRGYGRKTKGFRLVETTDSAENVGDEPLQMKQKFAEITVAVDEKRARGIVKLQELGCDLVILDDAFQHRSVKPLKSIVLMDYNRLPNNDFYLPSGNLRDGLSALQRADIICITKCSKSLSEQEKQQIIAQNKVQTPCFFTHFEYGSFRAFATDKIVEVCENLEVLLVTGIANPMPLQNYLESKGITVDSLQYADHYDFSEKDFQKIEMAFSRIESANKIILTTEKDKVKLYPLLQKQQHLMQNFYYLPIQVAFENEKEQQKFLNCLTI